jgi:hypothetical protein
MKSTSPVSSVFVYVCAAARQCGCHAVNCRGSGFSMTELVLKNIGKHFGAPPWLESEKDYIVLNDAGRIIGRIVMRAPSPRGQPWVWTITARGQPPSFYNHGYSETREQAMKDFKAQYRALEFHRLLMPRVSPTCAPAHSIN